MSVTTGRVAGTTAASYSHEGQADEGSLKQAEALLAKAEALLRSILKQPSRAASGHEQGHLGMHHRWHGVHHVHHAHRADAKRQSPLAEDTATNVSSVEAAQATVHPKFMPVLRGNEQQKDAEIKNQDDFARAVDRTAREYGLNPNVFRAQLQVESGAFSQGYQAAMHHEGDLDRAVDNNTSVGLGQISRKFLDGRDWAHDGPGNARVGNQVVTFDQYKDSPTVQLRMAASNLAQRIADHGGLERGLSYYVSGNDNPSNPTGASYIAKIDAALKDPAVLNPGR
jgi:hypothetical protein